MREIKKWAVGVVLALAMWSPIALLDFGREETLDAPVTWELLVPGQTVEFTLPGGWWHDGVFEGGSLPLMKSGDARYLAYVAKVEPTEGIWLSTVATNGPPISYGNVLTIPASLANSVAFDVLQSAP